MVWGETFFGKNAIENMSIWCKWPFILTLWTSFSEADFRLVHNSLLDSHFYLFPEVTTTLRLSIIWGIRLSMEAMKTFHVSYGFIVHFWQSNPFRGVNINYRAQRQGTKRSKAKQCLVLVSRKEWQNLLHVGQSGTEGTGLTGSVFPEKQKQGIQERKYGWIITVCGTTHYYVE